MKLKRIVAAAVVAASLGISAPSAHAAYRRVVRERIVVAVRMPNGALASLAGNVDPHHSVAVADLILAQTSVRSTVERLVRERQPDVVGLSVMTFQRKTALQIARLIRALKPAVRIVVGGYDASLAAQAFECCPDVEFIVRGEGERTLCELLRAIEAEGPAEAGHYRMCGPPAGGPHIGGTFTGIPGLSFR